MAWQLQGEVVPASEKEPDRYICGRQTYGGTLERIAQSHRAEFVLWGTGSAHGAGVAVAVSIPAPNEKSVLTFNEYKELERLRSQTQKRD